MSRRRILTADEQDIHTRWRHLLILQPGYVRFVKRATNRRERREGRGEIAAQINDLRYQL